MDVGQGRAAACACGILCAEQLVHASLHRVGVICRCKGLQVSRCQAAAVALGRASA